MSRKEVIEEQIRCCRKLLDVFRDERLSLGDGNLDMEKVIRILEVKRQILAAFESQKQLIAPTAQDSDSREKSLVRELGSLLEQLLVIDAENESLLRNLLGGQNRPPVSGPATEIRAARPGQPFRPERRSSPPLNSQPAIEPEAAASSPLPAAPGTWARLKLQAYK
jgi:flagellar biosynthesis/type III secretory pathway chaperone